MPQWIVPTDTTAVRPAFGDQLAVSPYMHQVG
jgi:hypothetical protein